MHVVVFVVVSKYALLEKEPLHNWKIKQTILERRIIIQTCKTSKPVRKQKTNHVFNANNMYIYPFNLYNYK